MPFALDDCGAVAGHWSSGCSCQCYSLFVKPACSSCNTASATFLGTVDSMSHSQSLVGLHYSRGFTSVINQVHMALSLFSLLFNIQPYLCHYCKNQKIAASFPASMVEHVRAISLLPLLLSDVPVMLCHVLFRWTVRESRMPPTWLPLCKVGCGEFIGHLCISEPHRAPHENTVSKKYCLTKKIKDWPPFS